ncbi:MAG: amidohydrolase family protein [Vicinamibacteria bacterium]
MTNGLRLMTALLLTLAALSAVHAQGVAPSATVFENVTVIPMDRDRTLPRQSVMVEGRRITAMGPAGRIEIPDDARRLDGSGKFLMPGLAEMHGHLPGGQALERFGQEYLDRILFLFVANGVTTVRAMLGSEPDLLTKAQIAQGDRIGPQLFIAGPSFNGRSVPTAEAAWRMVTEQRAAGFDLLKIHPGIKRAVYDELVATAQREGIPFAGHIPSDVGLRRAMMLGQATVEHLDGYLETIVSDTASIETDNPFFFGFQLVDDVDESKISAIAAATRAAGVWNTPTQTLFDNMFAHETPEQRGQRPEMGYMPKELVAGWVEATRQREKELPGYSVERADRFLEIRRKLVLALQKAGAGILLGADTPQVYNVPGFATLQELASLVGAGLTPYEALVAGTRNPAGYLDLGHSFGTVMVGGRADLILLNANPLENIENVYKRAGVMVAGRWLSAEEINKGLGKLAGGQTSD